jgi:putative redox protein
MTITVEGISGSAYRLAIGEHTLVTDQPAGAGGEDLGPTPTDLFVAGLAGCVAFYAGRFIQRRGWAPDAVRVVCDYHLTHSQPARVDTIRLTVELPPGLPADLRAAALRAARNCTVHNTLREPPEVTISMSVEEAAA